MVPGHLLCGAVTSGRVRSARVRRVRDLQNKVVRKGIPDQVTPGQRPKRGKELIWWLSEGRVAT